MDAPAGAVGDGDQAAIGGEGEADGAGRGELGPPSEQGEAVVGAVGGGVGGEQGQAGVEREGVGPSIGQARLVDGDDVPGPTLNRARNRLDIAPRLAPEEIGAVVGGEQGPSGVEPKRVGGGTTRARSGGR